MMSLDEDIQPLADKLQACMGLIRSDYLPALAQLNEDVVASSYALDEQVRIYLSVAFTLAMSLFSLDKLHNESHKHRPRVESKDNVVMACGGSACDARLMLQIERIMDTIKRVKEERAALLTAAGAKVPASPGAVSRKRGREERAGEVGEVGGVTEDPRDDLPPDNMGDAEMFHVVGRPELNVGKIVGRTRRS